MAAAHKMEMESVNLNMEREGKEELEEEKMRGDAEGKDFPRGRKVHRIVSKWMLPEPVRRTYLERANCLPPPLFIILISLAELAVFIYYAVWKPQKQWITLDTGILESPLTYRPEKREEAWRFISYMLVHAGVQHIVGNLFMQLVLGIPLEMVHKGLRVGLVYLAGVLAEFSRNDSCPWNHQATRYHSDSCLRHGIRSLQKILCSCKWVSGVLRCSHCRRICWNVCRLHCVQLL